MVLEKSETDFKILRRRLKQNVGAADADKYRFYGQHFPQLDEFLFKRYFPDVNVQGVFVECGANNGQAGSNCKFFEETMHWTGYNLEASPHTFQLLQNNRPNSINLNCALSDHCGEIAFALTEPICENPAYLGAVDRVISKNNLLHAGAIFTVSGADYRVYDTITVPSLTWKHFIEENNISFVDLFVLDTEGHEVEVIDGMARSPVLPSIICVEDGWRPEVRSKLQELGYVFDIVHFGNHMYVLQNLLGLFALRAAHKNY